MVISIMGCNLRQSNIVLAGVFITSVIISIAPKDTGVVVTLAGVVDEDVY